MTWYVFTLILILAIFLLASVIVRFQETGIAHQSDFYMFQAIEKNP
ncbi:Uncharacterised protein [Streptococcus constellatus]|uniref:Uncharacterized protein n=1 Tax=Streptococcus constellatus TaxID=76860 RepID=A0A564SUH2_STRCV|nr:hypothetical protein [Streptococcus constellatus]VUW98632.1 Uncharacterised protein [Streptococcus constellatus]VUX06848.1 Uncharacterised protein [Streptococcus gordonii]